MWGKVFRGGRDFLCLIFLSGLGVCFSCAAWLFVFVASKCCIIASLFDFMLYPFVKFYL